MPLFKEGESNLDEFPFRFPHDKCLLTAGSDTDEQIGEADILLTSLVTAPQQEKSVASDMTPDLSSEPSADSPRAKEKSSKKVLKMQQPNYNKLRQQVYCKQQNEMDLDLLIYSNMGTIENFLEAHVVVHPPQDRNKTSYLKDNVRTLVFNGSEEIVIDQADKETYTSLQSFFLSAFSETQFMNWTVGCISVHRSASTRMYCPMQLRSTSIQIAMIIPITSPILIDV
eukprot:3034382-Rhodomonas_salina.2